jgi:hypothetical protein
MARVARRFTVFSFRLFAKLSAQVRNQGRARADMRVPTARAIGSKINFQIGIVPADGT